MSFNAIAADNSPASQSVEVTDFLLDGAVFERAGETGLHPVAAKHLDGDSASSVSSDSSPSSSPHGKMTTMNVSPRGRKRSRATDQKQIRLPQRKGGLQLWQFLYALLEDPAQYSELIEWSDRRSELEFRMLEPEALAAWWGYIKHRPNMSYERLSRSLRFYYDKGILRKMGGERFLYRFCVSPEAMYEHIGNSDNRPSLKTIPAMVKQRMSKYINQHCYFYPQCYQQGYSTALPSLCNFPYVSDQLSLSLPDTRSPWHSPAVTTRPRLCSLELPTALPSYEDHLARCNSSPNSLTEDKTSCFTTDELLLIRAATEAQVQSSSSSSSSGPSSESCSPRGSTTDFDVDMVMQEILQLTDQYTQSTDLKAQGFSLPHLEEQRGCASEEPFFPAVSGSDDTPVFPTVAENFSSTIFTTTQTPHPLNMQEWPNTAIY